MALDSGTRLGPYEVIALLGAGGMGEVYRARDTKLNRDVALKILPEAFTLDGDRIARFGREAQVLASLNHPHIAAIYGFEDADGIHALVLELVDGPTLADRIAQGPLAIDEALPMAKQIAEAIEAAHEQGIIHRDLKPANIKLRPDGTVKVLDFGLAKGLDPMASMHGVAATASPTITTPAMTLAGLILGTAAYMSPEQARGRPVDKRTDVWAFGCVLFEMLTGRRAFDGEDITKTLGAVIHKEPDWTVIPATTPPAVTTALRRCLQKDPKQRVRDIGDVRLALEGAFESSTTAQQAAVEGRSRSFATLALAAVAALLAVGLAAALLAWRPWRSAASTAPLVARFSLPLPDPRAGVSQRQLLAVSPDGKQIVYVTGTAGLSVHPLGEFETRPILRAEQFVTTPVFAPDGRSIAFCANGEIKRISVNGGTPQTVCTVPNPLGITWDQSGLLVGQAAWGIVRCPAAGGNAQQIASVTANERASEPQILPGGEQLLFTISSVQNGNINWDQARIVVHSLKSGARKTILTGGSDARYLPTGHLLYFVGGVAFAAPFDLARLTAGEGVPVVEGSAVG